MRTVPFGAGRLTGLPAPKSKGGALVYVEVMAFAWIVCRDTGLLYRVPLKISRVSAHEREGKHSRRFLPRV